MAYKGFFRPTNPEKYNGDPKNIVYRSLWEAKFFRYCDRRPEVEWWSSEELAIPYLSPKDKRVHRYFPDVILKLRYPDGTSKTLMIEIKPKIQTAPPNPAKKNATKTGRVSRRYMNAAATYAINEAKWLAAEEFCKDKGWEFKIFTEKELGVR